MVSTATALVLTPPAVVLSETVLDFQTWLPSVSPEISNGLIPFAIALAGVTGFYVFMKRKFVATKAEAVQTLFVFLFTAFVVLTVIGVWFRGEGMALVLLGGVSP